MSMSTSVYGIMFPDEHWEKFMAVWNACRSAGVVVPEEVNSFFDKHGGFPPTEPMVDLSWCPRPGVYEYKENDGGGYEVVLSELDPKIYKLRFSDTLCIT